MLVYECLKCGSKHGEPSDFGQESWFWRILMHGRVGPFCSEGCSYGFHMNGDGQFTLEEWERLRFVRVTCREVLERRETNDVCTGCGRILSEHEDCLEETPA